KDDKYFAIQVKFIKDKTLYVNKLSTFYALNYSRPLYPIIFTSAKNIDKIFLLLGFAEEDIKKAMKYIFKREDKNQENNENK
ncbi:MAG: hypothetical protein QXP04_02210, partial [Candidatus Nanoarchaeia archaeon]|nr:hypothetical protein [Candidatus Jingweiarchaeum tengchongense]